MSSNREYMRTYMLKRYHRRRAEAIERMGGKCVDCGGVDELEFDHIDPSSKTHKIGKIMASGSEAMLQAELAKCVLRCDDCHKIKTRDNHDVRAGLERERLKRAGAMVG